MSVILAGAGPTVVLGSSFLWDAQMWAPQIEALSSRYRLIVPELWGHGGSGPLPPHTRDMRDLARQHLQLLNQLEIEQCAIVGLSIGGMWGAELALMAPERVSSLVLMGTSLAAEPDQARDSYFGMLDVVGTLGTLPDPVRDAVLPLYFTPDASVRWPELLAAFDSRLRAWDPKRLKDSVAPLGRIIFGRRDALGDLASLAMPALVMTGDGDLARPVVEGRAMADRIGCPFVTIPEAGHISSLEAPSFVNRTLAEFLDSNPATREPVSVSIPRPTEPRSSRPSGHAGVSRLGAIVVAALGLLAAPVASAAPLAAAQTLEDGWAQAFNGDVEALGALYEPDAWLVLPGSPPIRGRSAIQAELAHLAGHAVNMSLQTRAVQSIVPGYLVENGVARYEVPGAKPGDAPVTANYQVIWKRDVDGRWTIMRDVVVPL